MVRHIVFFWLKEKTPEIVAETVQKLEGMRGKIEGMLELEVGVDFLQSERSCDIVLYTCFDSRASLEAYQNHPVHLPVKKHMHAVRSHSASADFEV